MRRLAFLFPISLFLTACGNSSSSAVPQANSPSAAQDGWGIYEDDWFRVQYPAGSDVAGGAEGKQNPDFPTLAVVPPSSKQNTFGAFTLQFDSATKGMLLRDAIEASVKKAISPRGAILVHPQEVKVANGKCLTGVASRPDEHCPKGTGSCFTPFIVTVCDDKAGRRYTADTLLSMGKDPKALSPQAQQEAAVYERILRSLEFKKS